MWKAFKYALATGAVFALSSQVQAATPADTLVIAKQIDDIISLDPAQAYELSGIEMDANIYDRIMRFEPTDVTKLVPGVAESVTVSADGKTFTFKIRAGMKFASGNPVTAGDAAWSLQRVIKLQKTPVFLLSQLGWTADNVDKMVTAPDDATLQVTIGVNYAPTLVYRCSARLSARSSTKRPPWRTRPKATWAMPGSPTTPPARAPMCSNHGPPTTPSSSRPTRTIAAASPS